jgi:hypothetical protein
MPDVMYWKVSKLVKAPPLEYVYGVVPPVALNVTVLVESPEEQLNEELRLNCAFANCTNNNKIKKVEILFISNKV